MDNIDFEVLSRIQELYQRFGLKPYEVVATLDHNHDAPIIGMGVQFEVMCDNIKPGEEHLLERRDTRADAMLKAIGVDENGIIGGGEKSVIDALDAALLKSPKPLMNRV